MSSPEAQEYVRELFDARHREWWRHHLARDWVLALVEDAYDYGAEIWWDQRFLAHCEGNYLLGSVVPTDWPSALSMVDKWLSIVVPSPVIAGSDVLIELMSSLCSDNIPDGMYALYRALADAIFSGARSSWPIAVELRPEGEWDESDCAPA